MCYGTDANGTNVYQYTKDGSVEQKFKVVYDSSTDSYKLYAMCSSNGNNRVIDVKRGGAALASGQNVDIWTPVDHTAQRVEITYLTYNIYHIRMKANTGLYLTTRDSSNGTKAGTSATSPGNVHINSFDVNLNQQWAFEYLGTATPEPEPEPEPATPTGSLDVVNANVISGWAWRSDLPNSPINVNIQVIGSNGITYLNTTVSANEYNSTIYNTGYGNGYHGFSYDIDWGLYPSGEYIVRAYGIGANNVYTELTSSPKYYTSIFNDAILIGVTETDEGHDHIAGLNNAVPHIISTNFYEPTVSLREYTVSEINNLLNNNNNRIFVSRGHGGYVNSANTGNVFRTFICLSDDGQSRYNSDVMSQMDLSNMELIAFIGCHTGAGGANGNNLINAVVNRGARVAIGFNDTIYCSFANTWTEELFDLLSNGYSIQEAKYVLCGEAYDYQYVNMAEENVVIGGDLSYILQGFR